MRRNDPIIDHDRLTVLRFRIDYGCSTRTQFGPFHVVPTVVVFGRGDSWSAVVGRLPWCFGSITRRYTQHAVLTVVDVSDLVVLFIVPYSDAMSCVYGVETVNFSVRRSPPLHEKCEDHGVSWTGVQSLYRSGVTCK